MISALPSFGRPAAIASLILAAAALLLAWPERAAATLWFVVQSLLEVAPVIGLGLVLSAWVAASGAGSMTAKLFKGRPISAVMIASAVGSVTPVCGVTVLPLMVGLLASGVPLAPIMAFWLSSPVTDPGLFAATWAVLGSAFAIGKTLAAFALGIFAGVMTAALAATDMVRIPLRSAPRIKVGPCSATAPSGFTFRIWGDRARRETFRGELVWMTRLVILCLSLAFAAEYQLRKLVPPDTLAAFVGMDSPLAIPLAVTAGAPLYVDGYAALPLVRALLELGMSPGAALAFLVAGSAVSIWGVLVLVPLLRVSTVTLFIALAVAGSLAIGYVFDAVWPHLP